MGSDAHGSSCASERLSVMRWWSTIARPAANGQGRGRQCVRAPTTGFLRAGAFTEAVARFVTTARFMTTARFAPTVRFAVARFATADLDRAALTRTVLAAGRVASARV